MKKIKGFTLFELLVVISIIGILLGFGAVAFSGAQRKARDARRKEDLDAVQKALEQYYALESADYPAACYSSGNQIVSGTTTIMDAFPTDPKNDATYFYNCILASATDYCYCVALESTEGNCSGNCVANSCDFTQAGDKTNYCITAKQ